MRSILLTVPLLATALAAQLPINPQFPAATPREVPLPLSGTSKAEKVMLLDSDDDDTVDAAVLRDGSVQFLLDLDAMPFEPKGRVLSNVVDFAVLESPTADVVIAIHSGGVALMGYTYATGQQTVPITAPTTWTSPQHITARIYVPGVHLVAVANETSGSVSSVEIAALVPGSIVPRATVPIAAGTQFVDFLWADADPTTPWAELIVLLDDGGTPKVEMYDPLGNGYGSFHLPRASEVHMCLGSPGLDTAVKNGDDSEEVLFLSRQGTSWNLAGYRDSYHQSDLTINLGNLATTNNFTVLGFDAGDIDLNGFHDAVVQIEENVADTAFVFYRNTSYPDFDAAAVKAIQGVGANSGDSGLIAVGEINNAQYMTPGITGDDLVVIRETRPLHLSLVTGISIAVITSIGSGPAFLTWSEYPNVLDTARLEDMGTYLELKLEIQPPYTYLPASPDDVGIEVVLFDHFVQNPRSQPFNAEAVAQVSSQHDHWILRGYSMETIYYTMPTLPASLISDEREHRYLMLRFLDIPQGHRPVSPWFPIAIGFSENPSMHNPLTYANTVSFTAGVGGHGPEVTASGTKHSNIGGIKKPDVILPPMPVGGLVVSPNVNIKNPL